MRYGIPELYSVPVVAMAQHRVDGTSFQTLLLGFRGGRAIQEPLE